MNKVLGRSLVLVFALIAFVGSEAYAAKKAIATLRDKTRKTLHKVVVPQKKSAKSHKQKGAVVKRKAAKARALLAKARRQLAAYRKTMARLNRVMASLGKDVGVRVQGKKKCGPKCQERRFKRMQRRMKRLAKKNGWNH